MMVQKQASIDSAVNARDGNVVRLGLADWFPNSHAVTSRII